MRRHMLTLTFTTLLAATVSAQEPAAGPGRIELGAFPGGGMLFTRSPEGAPDFTSYTFGASITWNANRWIGAEAEAGFSLGGHKTVAFGGRMLGRQAMPDTIAYSGNIVVNPLGNRRRAVPYATAGLGGFRLVARQGVDAIGVTGEGTQLSANLGSGLKWYSERHWGLRSDYRFMVIQGSDAAPMFFGRRSARYGHRLYAGIFATF